MSHPPLKRRTRPTALSDILDGVKLYKVWTYLSYQDLISRYRRSIIGPFWIAAVMATQAVALSLVFGAIYHLGVKDFLPYVISGLTVINLIACGFNEGADTFNIYSPFIRAHSLPISFHVFRMVCRHFVVFMHNFIVYCVVSMIYTQTIPITIMLIPGLILAIVFMTSTIFITSSLSLRFIDFKFILPHIFTIVFYFTPVIWKPSMISSHMSLVYTLNPLYYLLEVVRSPLLGKDVPLNVWEGAIGVTLATAIIGYMVFANMRKKIPLWL